MKRLKTSIAAWSVCSFVAAFSVAAVLLSENWVRDISYALVTGVTAAGSLRYLPDAWRAFRNGRAGFEFLLVGVFALMNILLVHRVWVMSIAYLGFESDMVTYFLVWMIAWACGLILVAPDVQDGVIANRSLALIGVAIFIAGAVSGITIGMTIR